MADLREHDVPVREVNQQYAHSRRRGGKNHPIAADLAARLFLGDKATAIPRQTGGIVEAPSRSAT